MEERNKWGDRALFFILGGLVGATAALLFAPRSGEETREMIASKVKEGRDALTTKIKSAKEKIVETSAKLESTASRSKEALAAAIEAGKQAYRDEKESADKRKA